MPILKKFRRDSELYQFYANIHYTTCPQCLELHGKIFNAVEKQHNPPIHKGCRCAILSFPAKEKKSYREKEQAMRARVKNELHRRSEFQQAIALLEQNPDEAYTRFENSFQVEIFIGEIEANLVRKHVALSLDPQLASRLEKLFVNANTYKYQKEKYAHMPPAMQHARISYGEQVIKKFFRQISGQSNLNRNSA